MTRTQTSSGDAQRVAGHWVNGQVVRANGGII
jgi:hypothetical protein